MEHLIAFGALFFLTLTSGIYTKKIQEGKAFQAGCWSMGITLSNLIAVTTAIKNTEVVPAILLGSMCGTLIAVTFNNRNKRD